MFSYLAERSFGYAKDGTRLFYNFGTWTRPYIIPDTETEQRLFAKSRRQMMVVMAFTVIVQPVLIQFFPPAMGNSVGFIAYLAVIMTLAWIGCSLYFRHDLAGLERSPARFRIREYLASSAAKNHVAVLVLMLLGSLSTVGLGVWALMYTDAHTMAWVCMVVFSMAAVGWGYALFLKLTGREARPL